MLYCEVEALPAVVKQKPARESSETDLEIEGESGHSGPTAPLFPQHLEKSSVPSWHGSA